LSKHFGKDRHRHHHKLKRYKGRSFHLILVISTKLLRFSLGIPDLGLIGKGCVLNAGVWLCVVTSLGLLLPPTSCAGWVPDLFQRASGRRPSMCRKYGCAAVTLSSHPIIWRERLLGLVMEHWAPGRTPDLENNSFSEISGHFLNTVTAFLPFSSTPTPDGTQSLLGPTQLHAREGSLSRQFDLQEA